MYQLNCLHIRLLVPVFRWRRCAQKVIVQWIWRLSGR